MISSSLTVDRSSLGLDDLVLTNNPFDDSPYTYPEDGLAEPNFNMRLLYAPDSQWIPGRLLLGSVADGATVPLIVHVAADDTAQLKARKAALEAAFGQFSYTVTITVDDVELGTYPADATTVWWGVVDHGLAVASMAIGTVQIPVNPPLPADEES